MRINELQNFRDKPGNSKGASELADPMGVTGSSGRGFSLRSPKQQLDPTALLHNSSGQLHPLVLPQFSHL